jgi:hypothetical protein
MNGFPDYTYAKMWQMAMSASGAKELESLSKNPDALSALNEESSCMVGELGSECYCNLLEWAILYAALYERIEFLIVQCGARGSHCSIRHAVRRGDAPKILELLFAHGANFETEPHSFLPFIEWVGRHYGEEAQIRCCLVFRHPWQMKCYVTCQEVFARAKARLNHIQRVAIIVLSLRKTRGLPKDLAEVIAKTMLSRPFLLHQKWK